MDAHRYVHVDLVGTAKVPIDPELAERALNVADRFMKEYPSAAGILREISYSDSERGAYATVYNGTRLELNSKFWSSSTALSESLAHDEAEGWHPAGCGSPEAVIAHEFGHVLDQGSMRRVFDETWGPGLGSPQSSMALGEFTGVSRYGDTTSTEAWAESVSAAYYGTKAVQDSPQVKLVKSFLDDMRGK